MQFQKFLFFSPSFYLHWKFTQYWEQLLAVVSPEAVNVKGQKALP